MALNRLVLAVALFLAPPAGAESVIALHTIPARSVIAAEDLMLQEGPVEGAAARIADVVGLEARVTIFRGRPVGPEDLVRPALVERNATVLLVYRTAGLRIEAEGRALGRAMAGDTVRALNTGSRIVVTGRVADDGTVEVGLK